MSSRSTPSARSDRAHAALPVWLRGSFRVLRRGAYVALVRRDVADLLDPIALLEPPGARGEPLPGSGGRGGAYRIPLDADARAVVRPFRRGGLVRHLVRRRYLLGNRAFRELVATERLRRSGLPVAEPLAAVRRGRIPGYEALLVTREVAGARSLAHRLRAADPAESGGEAGARRPPEPEAAEALLARCARSIARLHAAGFWHRDLNAHNLLLPEDAGEAAVILDLDAGRFLPPPLPALAAERDLRRLRRSLRKLKLDRALERWEVFQATYRAAGAERPAPPLSASASAPPGAAPGGRTR